MYVKRHTTKKFWPIPRKGTKYVANPTHEGSRAIPLVVMMRDVLKLVKNKKELNRLLNEKQVLINQKMIRDTSYPIILFDSLSLPAMKKSYRAILEGKRIGLEEIKDKEAEERIYKITNKKQLSNKKIQLNLDAGRNIIADAKLKDLKTGDFVIMNTKENKIVKTNSLDKGSKVIVISGRHIGTEGEIKDIHEEGKNMIAEIKTKDSEIKVDIDNLYIKQ